MRRVSLLVNGILQVLLQPLGLWVDANFSVALQLGTVQKKRGLDSTFYILHVDVHKLF